ncbi:MAG: EF-hand domain pair [Verrucomicrobiota bacterium]|jgi:Ca2+-binding EF-hand superfamily protein
MKFLVAPLILALASCTSGPGTAKPENRTERQMLGLLEKFDRWDDNGDGELTAKEIDHGINRFKDTPMKVNYTGKQVVKFYDTDHNGSVSLREAQAGYRRADEVEGQLSR